MSSISLTGVKRQRTLSLQEDETFDNIEVGNVNSDLLPKTTGTWGLGSAAYIWLAAFIQTLNAGNIKALADATYDIGEPSAKFRKIYASDDVTAGTLNTHTIPAGSAQLADLSTSQTLTNKTLTDPVIPRISNLGTITIPIGTTTLVGRDTTDTLSNKTISTGWSLAANLVPDGNNTRDVGSSGNKLANVYSVNLNGLTAPTTGTAVATTGGSETLSNKTFSACAISGNLGVNTDNNGDLGASNKRLANIYAVNLNGMAVYPVSTTTASFAPNLGPITTLSSANQTWTLTKFSDGSVRCYVPALANISQSAVTTFHSATTTIPSGYRPTSASDSSGYEFIINDNGYKKGGFSVRSNGEVYIGTNVTVGNFSNAGTVGWPSQVVEWGTT